MRLASRFLSGLLLAAMPSAALASPQLNLSTVFGDAAAPMKLLMAVLIVASIAAVILTVAKLSRGRRLAGGSAFVSALRLGGPLLGLMGAAFTVLMMFIGMANAGVDAPMAVLAPGFAEAALLFLLGFLAGAVAVICHWAIEARIDRTVLSS